jgi:hypothetical protein
MGFIEETGAAQYLRDARITTIYEGTTAIQANDLIGRKIARDGGKTLAAVIAAHRGTAQRAGSERRPRSCGDRGRLVRGSDALEAAARFVTEWMAATRALRSRAPYLSRARGHRLRRRRARARRAHRNAKARCGRRRRRIPPREDRDSRAISPITS